MLHLFAPFALWLRDLGATYSAWLDQHSSDQVDEHVRINVCTTVGMVLLLRAALDGRLSGTVWERTEKRVLGGCSYEGREHRISPSLRDTPFLTLAASPPSSTLLLLHAGTDPSLCVRSNMASPTNRKLPQPAEGTTYRPASPSFPSFPRLVLSSARVLPVLSTPP